MKSLTKIVGEILDINPKKLDKNSSARNVPTWDSVNNLIIISEVEKEYTVKITISEVYKLKNLGDFFNLLKQKGAKITF
jgi:acyl carrier protein